MMDRNLSAPVVAILGVVVLMVVLLILVPLAGSLATTNQDAAVRLLESDGFSVFAAGQAPTDTPTFLVCSSTAQANQCDYEADGEDDHVQIQQAIDDCPDSGCRVVLTEGTFTGGQLSLDSGVHLLGMGASATTYQAADGTDSNIIINSDQDNGNTNISIRNFTLDGNGSNQASTSKGIFLDLVQGVRIEGMTIQDTRDQGIHTTWAAPDAISDMQDTVISQTRITGAGHHAFHLRGERLIATENTAVNAQRTGFVVAGTSEVVLQGNIAAENNQSDTSGQAGIYLEGTATENVTVSGNVIIGGGLTSNGITTESGHALDSLLISENVIDAVTRIGIETYATNAIVRDNYIKDPTVDGIFMGGNGALIQGNYIEGTGRDGVRVTGDNAYLSQNRFANIDDSPVTDNGSGSTIKDNRGFTTENSGTATIPNGSTSVAVSHSLGLTPALGEISVTPTNDLGNAAIFWISGATSSQFTINVDADPGADTATFAWRISLE